MIIAMNNDNKVEVRNWKYLADSLLPVSNTLSEIYQLVKECNSMQPIL